MILQDLSRPIVAPIGRKKVRAFFFARKKRTFGGERAFGLGALNNLEAAVDSGFNVESGFKVALRVQRRAPWPYA